MIPKFSTLSKTNVFLFGVIRDVINHIVIKRNIYMHATNSKHSVSHTGCNV